MFLIIAAASTLAAPRTARRLGSRSGRWGCRSSTQRLLSGRALGTDGWKPSTESRARFWRWPSVLPLWRSWTSGSRGPRRCQVCVASTAASIFWRTKRCRPWEYPFTAEMSNRLCASCSVSELALTWNLIRNMFVNDLYVVFSVLLLYFDTEYGIKS